MGEQKPTRGEREVEEGDGSDSMGPPVRESREGRRGSKEKGEERLTGGAEMTASERRRERGPRRRQVGAAVRER